MEAYKCCLTHKRNTDSAGLFDMERASNLCQLFDELLAGTWHPGTSICFGIEVPKIREVWAPPLRDRIVHWLWHNRWAELFMRSFIADSCACIPGRGTLYGMKRLDGHIRSATQNWSRDAFYLKCDVKNFFNTISKGLVFELLAKKIPPGWWLDLTRTIVFHDCTQDHERRGNPELLARVPPYKRLMQQPAGYGLPIGNLPSQHAANVVLNVLDQFIKHRLGVRYYVRYVDDLILLHESPQQLLAWLREIESFLAVRLDLELNPSKTIIQPISRGVDFVGHVEKPWATRLRRRTLNRALARISKIPQDQVLAAANSYLGLARQATKGRTDRIRLCRAALRRGMAVDGKFTKTSKGMA